MDTNKGGSERPSSFSCGMHDVAIAIVNYFVHSSYFLGKYIIDSIRLCVTS